MTTSTPIDESARLGQLYALDLLDGERDERFDRVTRIASRALRTPIALVSLVDAERQWFCSAQGLAAAETPRSDAFCSHAIAGDRPIMIVEDARHDGRFAQNPLVLGDPHIRFYAGAPIAAPGGELIGTLCIIDREPRKLLLADERVLRDLADLVEREILHVGLALTDSLTGLANRRAFTAAGNRLLLLARRREEPVSILCVDVDDLKHANDGRGHAAGDELLRRTGRVIDRAVRSSDVVARIGGDEFGVLLYGADGEAADAVVHAIESEVAFDNLTRAGAPPLSLSIGRATQRADDGLRTLLCRADAAMYRAKHHARTHSR